MTDPECIDLLQWALPRLRMRWRGFRKVRRQVRRRIQARMEQLGLTAADEYRAYLAAHPSEWTVLDGFCRISISRFYRDRSVFDCLRDRVLPELAQLAESEGDRQLRVWSAGCASGEEIYTVAILWQRCVAPQFPDVQFEVIATDAQQQMLDRACEARYPASSLKDLPAAWRDDAFDREGDDYTLRSEYTAGIEFLRQDIRTERPPGPMHLVLCRNLVLTYFDEDLQRETCRRIIERIHPGGLLVVGKHECLPEGVGSVSPYGTRLGMYRVG